MEPIGIVRSIWIAAPRQRVWQAVTEPKELEQWFLPAALGAQLKRDERDRLLVCMGPMEIEVAVLEAIDPPRQVTSRSLPDSLLATTFTLEEDNGGTQVTITMAGAKSLSEDAIHERLIPSGTGWVKALENLKAYIEGQRLPYPEGFIAALYGYRREAAKKIAVERSIWIAAPRERVWDAITDPDQIEHWFSPGTQWRGTGLHVSGKISVYDAETDSDMYTQVIDLVDPPHRFATHSEPEPPDTPHVTTWTLEEEDGGTRLTITFTGYEQEPDDVRYNNIEQNAFGFGMMLENLKAAVEGAALPYPGGF